MKRREWDIDKARALYDEGKPDGAIAKALGISRSTVFHWRENYHLPSNFMRGQQSGRTEDSRSPLPVSPSSRPLALPVMEGPVELSVEMDGHAFALRAPDLEGAARIYEYAGRLLKDMGQAAGKGKETCTS